jgi:spore coat protein CotF
MKKKTKFCQPQQHCDCNNSNNNNNNNMNITPFSQSSSPLQSISNTNTTSSAISSTNVHDNNDTTSANNLLSSTTRKQKENATLSLHGGLKHQLQYYLMIDFPLDQYMGTLNRFAMFFTSSTTDRKNQQRVTQLSNILNQYRELVHSLLSCITEDDDDDDGSSGSGIDRYTQQNQQPTDRDELSTKLRWKLHEYCSQELFPFVRSQLLRMAVVQCKGKRDKNKWMKQLDECYSICYEIYHLTKSNV